MAQGWEDGMAPKADDGASHNTAIAAKAAVTRLPSVRVGLVNRSPRCVSFEECSPLHEERRKGP
jgi:hypothetical protein